MSPAWRAGLAMAAALGLALFTIAEFARGAADKPRAVILALWEDDIRALAARSGYPPQDFWERARAIGARAVALSSPPAGSGPEASSWAGASGLVLALEPGGSLPPVSPAAPAGGTIYLTSPSAENFASILQEAKDRHAIAAWPDSVRICGFPAASAAGARGMLAASLAAESIPGQLWRAVWGRGARLLIVPMPAEDGVEPGLARLRRIAGLLRGADFSFGPDGAADSLSAWGFSGKIRCVLAFLLAGLAPMLAVRQGLAALRCVSCKTRWPQAFPVPEMALGLLRTAVVAAGAALACEALLSLPGWNLGFLRRCWDAWSFGVPLALSALALYAEDAKSWRTWLKLPARRDVFQAMAWILIAGLLIRPPRFPVYWLSESLWWLPLRWREALVGVPCLLMAFHIHLHRLESRQRRAASAKDVLKPAAAMDLRPWLLLGLLAPIGAVHAFGLGLMPPETLLSHTAQVFLIGSVLGWILIAGSQRRAIDKRG